MIMLSYYHFKAVDFNNKKNYKHPSKNNAQIYNQIKKWQDVKHNVRIGHITSKEIW